MIDKGREMRGKRWEIRDERRETSDDRWERRDERGEHGR